MDSSPSESSAAPFAANPSSNPIYSLDVTLLNAIMLFFSEASSRQNERLANSGMDKMTPLKEEIDQIFKTDTLLTNPSAFVGFSITPQTDNHYTLFSRSSDASPWRIQSKNANPSDLKMADWIALSAYANNRGVVVTAGYSQTGHNRGSAHGLGKAIDVRVWDHTRQSVDTFLLNAFSHGITVRDERVRPPNQEVWGGPHVHLETPKSGQAPRLFLSEQFNGSGTRVLQPRPAPRAAPATPQPPAATVTNPTINRP
jgi:hypothetical protein